MKAPQLCYSKIFWSILFSAVAASFVFTQMMFGIVSADVDKNSDILAQRTEYIEDIPEILEDVKEIKEDVKNIECYLVPEAIGCE